MPEDKNAYSQMHSDSKTISKAIGLKPSRTRDYLKQLVDEGILELEGEFKNRRYRIKQVVFLDNAVKMVLSMCTIELLASITM